MRAFARLCDADVDPSLEEALILRDVLLCRWHMATRDAATQSQGEIEVDGALGKRLFVETPGLVVATPQGRA